MLIQISLKIKFFIFSKINIVLKINEEPLNEKLKSTGKTREDFKQALTKGLEEDMGEIIEDNWELFDEVKFTVD